MLNKRLPLLTLGSIALLATACVGETVQPTTPAAAPLPDPGADGQYDPELPQPGRGDARYLALEIDPDVRCNLAETPKFPFDKAKMLAQYKEAIDAVASCLERPDLAGSTVYVVGHADPRGTDQYNKDLAKRRAEYIKSLLVSEGLPAHRIVVISEGEENAKGQSPVYSYGYDRRVELHVRDADFGIGPGHNASVEPVGGM